MTRLVFVVVMVVVAVGSVKSGTTSPAPPTPHGGERRRRREERHEGGAGGGETGGKFLSITVFSSRSEVEVKVNDEKVLGLKEPRPIQPLSGMTDVEKENAALLLAVFSLLDGRLMLNRSVNLHQYAHDLSLTPTLTSLAPGRLVVMAVKTEAALNKPTAVCHLFKELGAKRAHLLPVRGYLAWILTTGGVTWGEAVTFPSYHALHNPLEGMETPGKPLKHPLKEGFEERSSQKRLQDERFDWDEDSRCEGQPEDISHLFSSPVYMEVLVPLLREDCWGGRREGKEEARSQFCRKYVGYGDLCNCDHPAPLTYPEVQLKDSVIEDVPVGIVARARPQHLYKCLVTVLRQAGGRRGRVVVVRDGDDQEVTELLRLLQVRYVIHHLEERNLTFASSGARISLHYRFVLHYLFHTASPTSTKAIVLEEDLLVAQDFFSYFNQTAWLLDTDPSLFCVSAWNDLGALHVASRPDLLYRVETHAGYGWMLTRAFLDEVYDRWRRPDQNHDWDIWFRSTEVRAGRECVVPDVSRTYHGGLTGAHIKGVLTHAHFTAHPVTAAHHVRLKNVHRLTQAAYEEDLYKVLEGDNVYYLDNIHHPCSRGYVPKNFTAGPIIVFFSMSTKDHHLGWKKMGACLGVWNLDPRSQHRGLFRLTYYGTELYLIGFPYSDYSYLRGGVNHVVREPKPREEFVLGERTLANRARYRVPYLEHLAPYLAVDGPRVEGEVERR